MVEWGARERRSATYRWVRPWFGFPLWGALIGVGWMGNISAEEGPKSQMGYVETVSSECGKEGGYIIIPATKDPSIKGQQGQEILYAQDRIEIKAEGCTLTIRLDSSQKKIKTDYVIPSPEIYTLWKRIQDQLGFSSATSTKSDTVYGHGRGQEGDDSEEQDLRVPMLDNVDTQIQAGNRMLYLTWKGGFAPYAVMVYELANPTTLIAQREKLQVAEVEFESVQFLPGRYQITIRSASGLLHKTSFEVVEASTMPTAPPDLLNLGSHDVPPPLLKAMWLAGQRDGELIFEAYQQIWEISKAHPLAKTVLEKLERGWKPQP